VIIAQKVPATASSNTPEAKKLIEALGRGGRRARRAKRRQPRAAAL
jgi:hypothetical protein